MPGAGPGRTIPTRASRRPMTMRSGHLGVARVVYGARVMAKYCTLIYIVYIICLMRPSMIRKVDLPSKSCRYCGRPFAWRRKWARCWDEVRYCSQRCKREGRRQP
ncbi:DUF2256 domain-containing protein [Bisbaumannia pacifica]|uniref:DUF2256 domain-containing protein n=1 Tax=Bisbaumannia pacifica TaxID=77098 RepID=UPI00307AD32E